MSWRIEPSGPETFAISTPAGPVSRADFFRALASDRSARTALTETLRSSPHAAFAWETPALSATTEHLDAAFAIIDNPALARMSSDPSPFAKQLTGERVVTFANLGGDAVLVVPSPRVTPDAAHLAAFVRTAPDDLIDELWTAVGHAVVGRRVRPEPLWVSTAGLGVSWLHVRVDDRPKYYRHRAFTNPAA